MSRHSDSKCHWHRTERSGGYFQHQSDQQAVTVLVLDGPKLGDPVSGFEIPPDNGLGVSGQYIVSAENGVIEWSDVSGGNRFEQSLTDFWQPLGNYGFTIDARAQYDPVSNRFVVTNSASDAAGNYHFLVAVSKDGNPNDSWNYQQFAFPNTKDGIDQPNAATDGRNLYLAGSLSSQEMLVVSGGAPDGRAGIFTGSTGPSTAVPLGGGGIYRQDALPGGGDLVFAQQDGVLTVKRIDPASASIDAASTVSLGPISSVGEQEFDLPTAGTSTPLDAGDQRISGSAYSNGFLYCTFEVLPPSGPDSGVPTVHWAKLDVHDPANVRLVAQGNVTGGQLGAGVGTFCSSIAVDGNGDVLINFTATGPSMVPTDYYVVHYSGTAETAFSAPVEYKASVGPFVDPNADYFGTPMPVSRWGDYSSVVADPNNPGGFWISGEYGTTANSWQWGTAIAHVLVAPGAGSDPDDRVAGNGSYDHTVCASHGLQPPSLGFLGSQQQIGLEAVADRLGDISFIGNKELIGGLHFDLDAVAPGFARPTAGLVSAFNEGIAARYIPLAMRSPAGHSLTFHGGHGMF